ncbi:preprotein translocase subunit SecE [Candidatus Dependentiae bacterium]|nr:preprotein translocase subunit SecE [Candidatus Dependentiae bacterium]
MSNVTSFFSRITSFSSEVVAEIKKTTWPSRDELTGSMVIVCTVVVIFSAILGTMDSSFSYFIRQLIG